ncbi:MAG TPA: carboxylate-amine ligase, partial [Ardenticatenaceae bacterium]|nr:carboxylate-amine ligase [Ardenticatenaceae bacterium]
NVCDDVHSMREELVKMRCMLDNLARARGLRVMAAGTHPFSRWESQQITPFDRYIGVVEDMQDLARQLLIFGMHVHIGIEDREFMIDAMNVVRYMLPHILALSCSSPFWEGRDTGLKSYRSVIFRRFPRTGIPPAFTSWADYQNFLNTLVATRSIPDGSKIWWDVRPHHKYPTLEFRVADLCTTVDEAICLVAIFQALILKLWKMRVNNTTFRVYPGALIDENKWRAVRYGIRGKLIDFGRQAELPASDLIAELVDFVDDVLDELDSRRDVEYVFKILDRGNSAERQLEVYRQTGDLRAVVDHMIEETMQGCTTGSSSQRRDS